MTSPTQYAPRSSAETLTRSSASSNPEILAWSLDALERFADSPCSLQHEILAAASNATWAQGDFARSVELGYQAMSIDPAPGRSIDQMPENAVVTGLAVLGRWDEAVELCERMLTAARNAGDRRREMFWTGIEAVGYKTVGARKEAEVAARAYRDIALDIGSVTATANATFLLSEFVDDDDEAIALLDTALADARRVRSAWLEAHLEMARAPRVARRHDPVQARASIVALVDRLHRSGDFANSWMALSAAVDVFLRAGQLDVAATLHGAVRASRVGSGMNARRLDELAIELAAQMGADEFERRAALGVGLTLAQSDYRRGEHERSCQLNRSVPDQTGIADEPSAFTATTCPGSGDEDRQHTAPTCADWTTPPSSRDDRPCSASASRIDS